MLERCPRCHYSLAGLPQDHTCPECGLRYDGESVVYTRRRNRKALIGLAAVVIGSPGMIAVYTTIPLVPQPWGSVLYLLLGAYVITLGWLIWYFRRVYHCGSIAAITAEGLLLRQESRAIEMIPWAAILRCERSPGLRAAVLHFQERRATRAVSGVFRSGEELDDFVAGVNRRCPPPKS